MKKKTRRDYLALATRTAVFILCGCISLFLLLSGYESIFNRDLPLVHTLDTVNLNALSSRYDLPKLAATQTQDSYGNFGRPQTLKLPERSLRLDVTSPILEGNDRWLSRANTLHHIVLKNPRRGNIGLLALYCRSSVTTITSASVPQQGENMFMDTDKNWRYIYRVSSAKVVPANEQYVVADDGQTGRLVIICNDASANTDVIVEAALLSVQGISQ